jgi:thiosulfate/3-mercaptopyruvate sulfurtransferase
LTTENNIGNYLTSSEELAGLLGDKETIIIDTREPEDYIINHIPGAVNIYDIFTYLSTKENGGYEAMRRYFTKVFGDAGISGREKIIVYEDAMDNGYGRSCRGCFILNHLGHKNATVLHGGYQAWLNKNLPITKEIPKVKKKLFDVNVDHAIIITQEEMFAALNDPEIIILDCRDHAEWVAISSSPYGPDFAPRKGRIPGAIWIEWYNAMHYVDDIPWFKEPDELKKVYAKAGINEESKVYIYCFKGARTSNTFIAMKMAGIKNVRNYLGSWNEWSRDFSLPIERGYPRGSKKDF